MLHVDTKVGKASPASAEILAKLAEIASHHDKLPHPADAGRAIGQPHPEARSLVCHGQHRRP